MFEEYLEDAAHFLEEARGADDDQAARRAFRAAAMVGGAAMETFVNYIASTLSAAPPGTFEPYELALLEDRRFGQAAGVFGIQDQRVYSRLEDKLRFLITKFAISVDLGASQDWEDFIRFKQLRDSLVHSRTDSDETAIQDYEAKCSGGIRACFNLMNQMSVGIFERPLRARLRDLVDFGSQ